MAWRWEPARVTTANVGKKRMAVAREAHSLFSLIRCCLRLPDRMARSIRFNCIRRGTTADWEMSGFRGRQCKSSQSGYNTISIRYAGWTAAFLVADVGLRPVPF
jgi:hypothetical protein